MEEVLRTGCNEERTGSGFDGYRGRASKRNLYPRQQQGPNTVASARRVKDIFIALRNLKEGESGEAMMVALMQVQEGRRLR